MKKTAMRTDGAMDKPRSTSAPPQAGKLICACSRNGMGSTGVGTLLRTIAFGLIVLTVLLVRTSLVAAEADAPKQADSTIQSLPSKSDGSVRKIHDRINAYRSSQGLKPLLIDPFISKIAAEHSREMAEGKVAFGHEGFQQRAKTIEAKVKFRSIAENVGLSTVQADPEDEVVTGWLKSPGHLKNIKGDFELTGIGVSKKGNEKNYFTQIFLKKLE